ncbi:MAG TPA: type II toxin-antitoxin system VapC family toxin [Steroidobacter sp.]|uniref:type II toxin-antitoxin system tRNA(fMet)-specific endonuclease VapC n=1 Tax=Steroidobacter sp. TaxID=1978227 RepID=UPI002EDB68BC
MWMLDTDICIALIKRHPPELIGRLRRHKPGDVAISSITLAELSFGVAKSSLPEKNRAALEQFLLPLEVLAFDDVAASCYGDVRAALESGGTPIGPLDTLIASHALSISATIVTNNVREFSRVNRLRVENWMEPTGKHAP